MHRSFDFLAHLRTSKYNSVVQYLDRLDRDQKLAGCEWIQIKPGTHVFCCYCCCSLFLFDFLARNFVNVAQYWLLLGNRIESVFNQL